MIILDTNVLSALMRDVPDVKVASWLDQQPGTSIWTTSITMFEIQIGLQIMPVGKKKTALSEEFERLLDQMGHRSRFRRACSDWRRTFQRWAKKAGGNATP
jgi:predicted nucleic acid-binding protein